MSRSGLPQWPPVLRLGCGPPVSRGSPAPAATTCAPRSPSVRARSDVRARSRRARPWLARPSSRRALPRPRPSRARSRCAPRPRRAPQTASRAHPAGRTPVVGLLRLSHSDSQCPRVLLVSISSDQKVAAILSAGYFFKCVFKFFFFCRVLGFLIYSLGTLYEFWN